MKRCAILLTYFMIIFLLSGCEHYRDAYINVTLPNPDVIGVKQYEAGVSAKKNAARIFQLSYELDAIKIGYFSKQ